MTNSASAIPGARVFVLIPTHTTRHLACCLAALGRQSRPPDGVVVTCDNQDPAIGLLLQDWWPRIRERSGTPAPLWHVSRPFQGQAHLNQVRNNGLRALIDPSGASAAGRDLVIVLDGDTMLAPDAVALHAAARDEGADVIIPYRVMLDEAKTASISADRVLGGQINLHSFVIQAEVQSLEKRQRRYRRHAFWRSLGLGKLHKPKIIGGHHAFTIDAIRRVNGFDELYIGYRFDDDDLSRRLNSLRPAVRSAIACTTIHAFHLWHPTRATTPPEQSPGYARFTRTDLPVRAENGLSTPAPQGPVSVSLIGAPSGRD